MIIIKITKNITLTNRTVYKNRRIEFIVLHYFGALSSAKNNVEFIKNNKDWKASAHYFIDELGVWQSVEDAHGAWHCGDKGLGEYKGICRNNNSLGIEMRPSKINKNSLNSSDRDWYFSEETITNTIELVRRKMEEYDIPIENVIRHYDVTAKWCPRPFVGTDINLFYNKTGNQLWAEFKRKLLKEETEMTGEEIFKKLNEYLTGLPTSEYAKESSQKGVNSGLFADGNKDGLIDAPRGILTREQLAVVMNRAGLLDK